MVATPTQIQQATTAALDNSGVPARTANLQSAMGYVLGSGGDTRLLGIKPRSANYNAATDYSGNVTGE